MTDPHRHLTAPAVFLVPERHAFLVLGFGNDPVQTWTRDYAEACDDAAKISGLVVAVPLLADYSGYRPEPTPPPLPQQPPPSPDTPSGSGDAGGWAVGGRTVGSDNGWDVRREPEGVTTVPRDLHGWDRRTPAPISEATGWVGDHGVPLDLADDLRGADAPPAEVVAAAYAARGVAVAPEAIDAMRSTPEEGPPPAVLTRVRDGLVTLWEDDPARTLPDLPDLPADEPDAVAFMQRHGLYDRDRATIPVVPSSPPSDTLPDVDDPTVQIDRRPRLRAV